MKADKSTFAAMRPTVVICLLHSCVLLMFTCNSAALHAEVEHPLEGAITSSPRSTIVSFLEGWNELFEEFQKQGEADQVSIPNEDMARSDIENIGRRPHIRRISDIAIPLDTPPERAVRAVEIICEILAEHEGQQPELPPRVYLSEFNRDSLQIRMIYWYHPPNYWDYMTFGQKVNVAIMERFKAEGIQLALPTTTTFLAQNEHHPSTLDSERLRAPLGENGEGPSKADRARELL